MVRIGGDGVTVPVGLSGVDGALRVERSGAGDDGVLRVTGARELGGVPVNFDMAARL